MHRNTSILSTLLVLAGGFLAGCGGPGEFVIGLGDGYPPFDVGSLEGLNYDVLTAVCDANDDMDCDIQDAPYSDCFTTDDDGNAIIGAKLDDGTFDGCMGWYLTQARRDLGITFSEDYVAGMPTSLIALEATADITGTDLGGASVGFISGYMVDQTCLDKHYSNYTAVVLDDTTAVAAAVVDGTVLYAFWDSVLPDQLPEGTKLVGDEINDCTDEGLGLAAYGDNAEDLVEAFNTGLDLLRDDGTLEQLCEESNPKHAPVDLVCNL